MKQKAAICLTLAVLVIGLLCSGSFVSAQTATPVLKAKNAAMAFEGAVEYVIYFTVTNPGSLTNADYGLITFSSNLTDGTIEDAVTVVKGAKGSSGSLYSLSTEGIPAKNLCDSIYFKLYAQMPDGSYVYSKTYTYSAATYVADRLKNSTDENFKALLLDMVDYASAAQIYFNYKTDDLLNACFTQNQHKYGDWIVDTPASLTAEGSRHRTCGNCGKQETEAIAQLTVASLDITASPNKTTYYTNEAFDAAGMVVTATLSDGSTMAVTDYTVNKTILSAADTLVTVSFGGQSAYVGISVSETALIHVSDLKDCATGSLYAVEGYYVGVAEEGASSDKELLLKDVSTDDIIAVRNIPYGTFPDYGYQKGDRVRLLATYGLDGTINTPNKYYLDFSADNGDIASTIVSSGNTVSYSLTNTIKVSSWEQMQELFAVGTIPEYAYIEFTGDLYINRYTGSDGITFSRLHMNSAATAVSGIKPDGSKTASLRDNVMDVNLGENWADLFFDEMPATGKFPGYKAKGKLIALYTGGNNYYYQLNVLDASWVELVPYDNGDVLTETAYSYYRQGTQIQYDMTQSRRNINISPEDATAQNTVYLDCSSFVNSVYQEAFGVDVMDNTLRPSTLNFTNYAMENAGVTVDALGHWVNADYTTASAISNVLSEVRAQLQIGDVLVYRHGTPDDMGGHVYIYWGDDTFIHCTGSSYVYGATPYESYDKATTDEKTGGAVQLLAADEVFVNTASKRYLFRETASDTVYSFSLLRPLNRGLTPTEEARSRMKAAGLTAEHSVSVGMYNTVTSGETVTYTLTLTNTSGTKLNDVAVSLTLPACAHYVSGDLTADGQTLSWTGNLTAGKTVTLTYTVQITAEAGTAVEVVGTVSGVAINPLVNTVSGYTDSQLATLADTAKGYVGRTFSNPIGLATTLYSDVFGRTVIAETTAMSTLSAVIDKTNDTCRTDTATSAMVVPNLYGGLDIKSGFVDDIRRTRLVIEEYLAIGDIIVAEYDGISDVFIYVGNSTLIGVNSSTKTCTTYTISGDAFTADNILVTLIAYDRYAILRPSMTA